MKGVVNSYMFFLTLMRLCHYLQLRLQLFIKHFLILILLKQKIILKNIFNCVINFNN